MRVLLVDDEEQVVRSLLRVLRRRPGLQPVGVLGPAEARAQLEQGSFDAVVVDHHLADGASGLALLQEVAERWPRVRRVLCTGGLMPGEESMVAGCGAHALLYKPATVEEILAAVQQEEDATPKAAVG